MSEFKRRDFLKATAGVAAGTALGSGSTLLSMDAAAQQFKVTPEKDAKLRVLRWKRFVQGDEDKWAENTKKFTQATGIDVRIWRMASSACTPITESCGPVMPASVIAAVPPG